MLQGASVGYLDLEVGVPLFSFFFHAIFGMEVKLVRYFIPGAVYSKTESPPPQVTLGLLYSGRAKCIR